MVEKNHGGETFPEESGKPIPSKEKLFTTDRVLRDKIDLMAARLKCLNPFDCLSPDEFLEQIPGFSRLMPLLAQSVIDIGDSLLRRYTTELPHSYYDIIDSCEQRGILPASLVEPLARQLVLIEQGFEKVEVNTMKEMHRALPRITRTFEEFLKVARTFLNHSSTE